MCNGDNDTVEDTNNDDETDENETLNEEDEASINNNDTADASIIITQDIYFVQNAGKKLLRIHFQRSKEKLYLMKEDIVCDTLRQVVMVAHLRNRLID